MPVIAPVTRETLGARRWKKGTRTYAFAAQDTVAPLVVAELPQAAVWLPTAFVPLDGTFTLAAVQGLTPGQNLFVLPNGAWAGPFIPAAYRGYPFTLARIDEDREIVCFIEDSGLLTDDPDSEAFFDEDGKPSKAVAGYVSFFEQLSASRQATRRVCETLKAHGLIQPWPVVVKTLSGDQRVDGLHRIDEAALNALSGEAFLEVRAAGGLPVAYCQLLSMQHLPALGQLANARAEAAARQLPVNEAGELDLEFMNDGPMLDFSRLK